MVYANASVMDCVWANCTVSWAGPLTVLTVWVALSWGKCGQFHSFWAGPLAGLRDWMLFFVCQFAERAVQAHEAVSWPVKCLLQPAVADRTEPAAGKLFLTLQRYQQDQQPGRL